MKSRFALGMVLMSCTVACAPRISQWVQVTDCAQPHVVVPNARVYAQSVLVDDGHDQPSVYGHPAPGGHTDAQGNTWASFSVNRRSVLQATVHHDTDENARAAAGKQTISQVPPNPTQAIHMCVNHAAAK